MNQSPRQINAYEVKSGIAGLAIKYDCPYCSTRLTSNLLYPAVKVKVFPNQQRLEINGVVLTAQDFRDMLLAIGGRGAMVDFEGYSGAAPSWLTEQVLTPTGYIGKTPKVP